MVAAANGNITTYAPLDIKALEKTITPITKLLGTYKEKLYCDKIIKDYGRDLEEIAKVNGSKVEKYVELVKQVLLEVPALRKIASNDTKEGRGNCTYVIPATNETDEPTSNSSGMSNSTNDSNSTDNVSTSGNATNSISNGTDSSANTTSGSSSNASTPVANASTSSSSTATPNATSISQIIAQAIKHNGGGHNIVTFPENDTVSPSEPSSNSTVAGGATTLSNSTGNSTSNQTSNSTGNSTGNSTDDTNSTTPTANLTGPSAQAMAREVHYLLDPT